MEESYRISHRFYLKLSIYATLFALAVTAPKVDLGVFFNKPWKTLSSSPMLSSQAGIIIYVLGLLGLCIFTYYVLRRFVQAEIFPAREGLLIKSATESVRIRWDEILLVEVTLERGKRVLHFVIVLENSRRLTINGIDKIDELMNIVTKNIPEDRIHISNLIVDLSRPAIFVPVIIMAWLIACIILA